MSAIIEAAVIAAGASVIGLAGTAFVAFTGFRNTRKATEQTLRAAKDERLWEKRAATYERAIAALLSRREFRKGLGGASRRAGYYRRYDLSTHYLAENISLPPEPFFDRYEPVGWLEIEARLFAYATAAVLTALQASREANDKARKALEDSLPQTWTGDVERLKTDIVAPTGTGMDADPPPESSAPSPELAAALREAEDEAEAKDTELINAIRAELQGDGA